MKEYRWTKCASLMLALLVVGLYLHPAFGKGEGAPWTTLPELSLELPDSTNVQEYLGLKDVKSFTITQIPAKLILVEFYSVFCPICQKQAPVANNIYKIIKDDPELSKDIKMLGIGIGNKPYEIGVYKKNFNVPFPLFADPNKEIQEKSAIEHIPLTVLVDQKGKVLLSHLGLVKSVDEFIGEIRAFHKKQ